MAEAKFTLLFNEQRFGPHTSAEIRAMHADGTIDDSAQVWMEGWPAWQPVSMIVRQYSKPETAAPEPPIVPEYSFSKTNETAVKYKRKLRGYRHRVGKRSFIFQIILFAWTLLYVAWLISLAGSAASNFSSGPYSSGRGSSFSPSLPNPFDMSAGFLSGWICLGAGWCVIGLPVGIAAVATLRDDLGERD